MHKQPFAVVAGNVKSFDLWRCIILNKLIKCLYVNQNQHLCVIFISQKCSAKYWGIITVLQYFINLHHCMLTLRIDCHFLHYCFVDKISPNFRQHSVQLDTSPLPGTLFPVRGFPDLILSLTFNLFIWQHFSEAGQNCNTREKKKKRKVYAIRSLSHLLVCTKTEFKVILLSLRSNESSTGRPTCDCKKCSNGLSHKDLSVHWE